jgi:hypothetical protein
MGIWLAKTAPQAATAGEGARFWGSVMTDLKNRGVRDILIACCDGLAGFEDAITSAFPAPWCSAASCITPTCGLCRPGGGICWWRPDGRREGRHNPDSLIDTRLVGFPTRKGLIMQDPSRARVTGPLQPYAAGFIEELSRLGYTAQSACGQVLLPGLTRCRPYRAGGTFCSGSPGDVPVSVALWA